MKKIIIRANGSKDIGLGHINRCLIIADYLYKINMFVAILVVNKNNAV